VAQEHTLTPDFLEFGNVVTESPWVFAPSTLPFTVSSAPNDMVVLWDFNIQNEAQRGLKEDPTVLFNRPTEPYTIEVLSTVPSTSSSPFDFNLTDFQMETTTPPLELLSTRTTVASYADISAAPPIGQFSGFWGFQIQLDLSNPYVNAGVSPGSGPSWLAANGFHPQDQINHPLWNGYLSFRFIIQSSFLVNYDIGAITISGPGIEFHTGFHNRSYQDGRPVHDMKSGLPTFAEKLQEDGFFHGIWTEARHWDPEDPRNVRQVEFPDEEGTKKDEVPI
jgi:hypothetical protein